MQKTLKKELKIDKKYLFCRFSGFWCYRRKDSLIWCTREAGPHSTWLIINQENELQDVYLELDSISNLLNDKILTISQLGGEIDYLLILKETIETEI